MYYHHHIDSDRNAEKIAVFNEKYGDDCDFPFIRFWSTKCVQVDGDLTIQLLKELTKLMESFEDE